MGWWADWWNSVAQFFGYEEWLWGSAADWFAAIGTAGALLLGVLLLWRELTDRRAELANQVSISLDTAHVGYVEDPWVIREVHFHNGSPLPIYAVTVYDFSKSERSGALTSNAHGFHGFKGGTDALPAGRSLTYELQYRGQSVPPGLVGKFVDGRGRLWFHDLEAGKRYRGARRVLTDRRLNWEGELARFKSGRWSSPHWPEAGRPTSDPAPEPGDGPPSMASLVDAIQRMGKVVPPQTDRGTH